MRKSKDPMITQYLCSEISRLSESDVKVANQQVRLYKPATSLLRVRAVAPAMVVAEPSSALHQPCEKPYLVLNNA